MCLTSERQWYIRLNTNQGQRDLNENIIHNKSFIG